uniref:FHA domain-containing protein n=1 Tax=Nothobranchius furzeri TaxID=105023 RepID=A0A8C6LSX0_NOTFU
MPLHGKIVVIKRSGGDGTEFPLTTSCLFGRKEECDIRIQLPSVSKEHCRIDLNENKEVILTNLSSVSLTRVNGKALQQSERLKHGDVITILDRSFRFEYPPASTPKKRISTGAKSETLKVNKSSMIDYFSLTCAHLKDGANIDNIQRSLEKELAIDSKEDESQLQNKTNSPFGDLYQMIKKSLDVETPRKSTSSQVQTPSSRLCTPKPRDKPAVFIPMKEGAELFAHPKDKGSGTPWSVKNHGRTTQVSSAAESSVVEGEPATMSEATSVQRRSSATPQRFSVAEVLEQISSQTVKSPTRRRSNGTTPAKSAASTEQEEQATKSPKTETLRRTSPRNPGTAEKGLTVKFEVQQLLGSQCCTNFNVWVCFLFIYLLLLVVEVSKKRKSEELGPDLPASKMKKKRVSFGGQLSPELFDKRLPPDSPLRRGATPRRSLSLLKPKRSLLRRASVIGLPTVRLRSWSSSPAQEKSPCTNNAETPPMKKWPRTQQKSSSPGQQKSSCLSESTPVSLKDSSLIGITPGGVQTPMVQGRFSVSRICTPSPSGEADSQQELSVTVTPKVQLKRKSMKSTSLKTPSVSRSAVKILQRRSGISRASMKVLNSWADIVKFGQTKAQVVAPAKQKVAQKTAKKRTPARNLKGHASTGHADSPATIVVGRAHKRMVVHQTGAAPKVVLNTALFIKDMKMDEDLTGVSEMFKTPATKKKRRSLRNESSGTKTPAAPLGTSAMEPSVLNTPEEPGEMMVSPLSVASTVKSQRYNSEAVRRLLSGDQESSFIGDVSAPEVQSESSKQQRSLVTTPKQKPELPEFLTGVKRIMKTPKQKAEPIEDLRGKVLKTPKQKVDQQECLTGVKRIMKTPKQKAEPIEDLRGKVLKTPKQKVEQQECLTGVKRVFKTPKQKSVEVSLDGVKELLQTLTPVVKYPAVEDMVGLKRLVRTPKEKGEPVTENFGIKRLMKSPRLRGVAPVEDFEGLQELMQEPPTYSTQMEMNEVVMETLPPDVLQQPPGEDNKDNSLPEVETSEDKVTEVETSEDKVTEQLEVLPVAQAPEMMNPPSDEVACEATQTKPAAVGKKPVRGRKAMSTESKEAEPKPDAAEPSEEPVGPALVRGRRAKKTDAAAPSAVLRTTRTRNAKSQDMTTEQPAVETLVITGVSTEASDVQTTQEKMDLLLHLEKVASKPARERKAKPTPAEPKKSEDENSENVASNAQHPLPIPSAAGKPKRERKVEVEQSKVVDNTDVPEEIKPQPPVRAKRGRNAQPKEEVQKDVDVITTSEEKSNCQEPVKKSRRTRKAEQEQVKPTEEIQTDEVVVPEKADAPPAEPEKSEQATVAAKPRRGGRKAKPDTESATPGSTEVFDGSTGNPKGS